MYLLIELIISMYVLNKKKSIYYIQGCTSNSNNFPFADGIAEIGFSNALWFTYG